MYDRVRKNVEIGLDHFDPENRLFPEIATRISAGQDLAKKDILQIMAWKLGHFRESNADTVSDENLAAINKAIKNACELGCCVDALKALEGIHGIGLGTATAILAVCYPEEYTIIDWRVSAMLNLSPSRKGQKAEKKRNSPHFTANEYIVDYLPMVKKQRDLWGATLRDTYRALCGLWLEGRISELIEIRFKSTRHSSSTGIFPI